MSAYYEKRIVPKTISSEPLKPPAVAAVASTGIADNAKKPRIRINLPAKPSASAPRQSL